MEVNGKTIEFVIYSDDIHKKGVLDVCIKNGLTKDVPEYGVAFVALADKVVIGFIWSFHDFYNAYIDNFVVDHEWRQNKKFVGVSEIAFFLMMSLLSYLRTVGVKKLYGITQANKVGEKMHEIYKIAGMNVFSANYSLSGDLDVIMDSMDSASRVGH